jgi:hypothetical protein
MKNSYLLIGSGALAIAGATYLSCGTCEGLEVSRNYQPKSITVEAPIADGQYEFWEQHHKNLETGVVNPEDAITAYRDAMDFIRNSAGQRSLTLDWWERGPDNIGGRTRAICIDVDNNNHIWAGGVSGGLWESLNGANTWSKVMSWPEDALAISTISQAEAGTKRILVGLNNKRESGLASNAKGIYESTDDGATWTLVTGTSTIDEINEIVDVPGEDKFYISTSSGLKLYDNGSLSNVSVAGSTTGDFEGLDISADGNFIIVGKNGIGVTTYLSEDGGSSFASISGNGAGELPSSSRSRIEYAFSEVQDNGKYLVIALTANGGQHGGTYASKDNGTDGSWNEVIPSSVLVFGSNGQGRYDNIAGAHPTNPNKFLVGGVDLFKWEANTSITPIFGQYAQASYWFLPPNDDQYVHADNHEMVNDGNGNLYVGNDGGVGKSLKNVWGEEFYPANRFYNITQFYNIAVTRDGLFMGGTQDNGTLFNDLSNTTPEEFQEIMGGDGFTCDASQMVDDVFFASIYNGGIQRTDDAGFTWDSFYSSAVLSCGNPGAISGGLGQFRTTGRLYENPNDLNSTDSILFIADEDYSIGDTIIVLGNTFQNEIEHVLTQNINHEDSIMAGGTVVENGDTLNFFLDPIDGDTIYKGFEDVIYDIALDTIKVQDPVQSMYAFGLGTTCGGVWITRDAMRFGKNPFWWNIGKNQISIPSCIEFSPDGNHCYVASINGVWRISGLNTLYGNENTAGYPTSSSPNGSPETLPATVTVTQISSLNSVSGIGIDYQNPGTVVLTQSGGGSGTRILRSTVAETTSTNSSFTSIMGDFPGTIPVYDAIVDVEDASGNNIVIATDYGVYATGNGGSTWEYQPGNMGMVPTYEIRQVVTPWDQGGSAYGMIYAGTFGRGIHSTGSLVGIDDSNSESPVASISNLSVYPNPMVNQGQIAVDLTTATSNVTVNVYSLTGKLVSQVKAGNLGKGNHVIDLNVSNLSAGTYIVQLQAGNENKTAKIVVSK